MFVQCCSVGKATIPDLKKLDSDIRTICGLYVMIVGSTKYLLLEMLESFFLPYGNRSLPAEIW